MITREDFFRITGHYALYSIMPIQNIPSVMEHGVVSHDIAKNYVHNSVALEDVQEKREAKVINARGLHSYANLYFDPHNPMLSTIRHKNQEICLLAINPEVLNLPDVVVTDRNAAASVVRFIEPKTMTKVLDFDRIYMKYWRDPDNSAFVNADNKAIKCAEVLVPDCVPYEYVMGAVVINSSVKQKLIDIGFDKTIRIDSSRFFLERRFPDENFDR